jgi:hypothetical protein
MPSIAITKDVYGHQSDKKARCQVGNGLVSWARSEGLEPPTF